MPDIKPVHKDLFNTFIQGLEKTISLYSSGSGKLAQDELDLTRHFADDSLPIFAYPKFIILYNKFEDDLKVLR